MDSSRIKYNPGILGPDELVRSFVVRYASLDLILEALRENAESGGANRHLLIVGPRGSGKTMLVRRAAAEVRANPAYKSNWYPIVFAEESYPVGTPGEFWLEALSHLADQTADVNLAKSIEELREEPSEARLRERALGQLMDFADRQSRRLLLVVENLNILLADQLTRDAAWDLRHTLANEPRLMLLGTATTRFDEVTHIDRAWFEMFTVHELKPLNGEECRVLWEAVAYESPKPRQLKAVRILTGGNPRLLTVLAGFAANRSFRELMDQLVHLIDDHTEYFKGHLDALAAKERKVFVALLERWDPMTAAEVGQATRVAVNEASSLLSRLERRGAVEVVERKPRRKLYQVVERLYNIYYLMRRRGHPSARVQAAVRFMVTYFQRSELAEFTGRIAQEACDLPPGMREDHYLAYWELIQRDRDLTRQAVLCTPREFFEGGDAPQYIRTLPKWTGVEGRIQQLETLVEEVSTLHEAGRLGEAQNRLREVETQSARLYRDLVELRPTAVGNWIGLGKALARLDDHKEAEQAFRKAIELEPGNAAAWRGLGRVLRDLRRSAEAEQAFREAVSLEPTGEWHWHDLGHALEELSRQQEAEGVFRKAIALKPDEGVFWNDLGRVLAQQKRWKEAEETCRRMIELRPSDSVGWNNLGYVQANQGRLEEAEQSLRHAITLDPANTMAWRRLGEALADSGRKDEAKQAFQKVIELGPENPDNWYDLGHLLLRVGPPEEAEEFWAKALEAHPTLARCSVHLLELRLQRGLPRDVILREAEKWVERSGKEATVQDAMARFILREGLWEGFGQAEGWAREAFSKEPDWETARTVAHVLAEQGNWEEALRASVPILEAASTDEEAQQDATAFLMRAAAAGHVHEALETLKGSRGAAAMEPLAVGLQIYAGETPRVAKEILEIGQDVAEQIRELQSRLSR